METSVPVLNRYRSPSNPCGSNYTTEHLTDILDFAARHRLPVISDEIYGDIVFKGEQFTALAALNHARSQAYTPGSSPPEKSPVPLLTVGQLKHSFAFLIIC
jgi:bifunctional pyridoxal-dependent enzyme with beta-cystathionase and maltose regulon repressor activities